MAAAGTTALHQLKLVIDPITRRVVFAEARGEAIQFLHSVLASPHVSLPFDGASRYACIGNVYDSVDKLRAFAAAAAADVCRCGSPSCAVQRRQQQAETKRFYVCGHGGASGCWGYVSEKSGARCPSCGGHMDLEVPPGVPGASTSDAYAGPGLTAGADVTCMVLDDLDVMPAAGALSAVSSMMMRYIVAPGTLQEQVVSLGYTEAMEILETSLQSCTVLTDVFLRNKKARPFGKSPQ